MLKVSVALCTYNGEKYIEKQLNSLITQHRLPDEVVIVDDASSDLTVSIIKNFIEENSLSNFKLIINEKNLGFKENFKKALSLTTGDICFLCDQDDIWCDDKIETGMSIFADEKVMGISTGFTLIDGQDNDITEEILKKNIFAFTNKKFKKTLNKISIEAVMHRNISPGFTSAYRRKVIDIFLESYDSTLPHDYQLNAISAVFSGYFYYNAPLNYYRIHSANTLGLNPLTQTREDIAKEKLDISNVVAEVNAKGKALNNMCQKRYKAIKNKSLIGVLSLYLLHEYIIYYSFKEKIGDILYVFKR